MPGRTVLPDVGLSMDVYGIQTNYHECGVGNPVILLHGSGPGVTASQRDWRTAELLSRA